MSYLNNGDQPAYPSLGAAQSLPASNIDSRLDQANGGESALATPAIQVSGDAGLELVHKHGRLRGIALELRVLRSGQGIAASEDMADEGRQGVRELRRREGGQLPVEDAEVRC